MALPWFHAEVRLFIEAIAAEALLSGTFLEIVRSVPGSSGIKGFFLSSPLPCESPHGLGRHRDSSISWALASLLQAPHGVVLEPFEHRIVDALLKPLRDLENGPPSPESPEHPL